MCRQNSMLEKPFKSALRSTCKQVWPCVITKTADRSSGVEAEKDKTYHRSCIVGWKALLRGCVLALTCMSRPSEEVSKRNSALSNSSAPSCSKAQGLLSAEAHDACNCMLQPATGCTNMRRQNRATMYLTLPGVMDVHTSKSAHAWFRCARNESVTAFSMRSTSSRGPRSAAAMSWPRAGGLLSSTSWACW